jgi:hypothetical protein
MIKTLPEREVKKIFCTHMLITLSKYSKEVKKSLGILCTHMIITLSE